MPDEPDDGAAGGAGGAEEPVEAQRGLDVIREAGRPRVLNAVLREQVVGLVKGGIKPTVAMRALGLDGSTMSYWKRRAKNGEEPYVGFIAEVEAAAGQIFGVAQQTIYRAGADRTVTPRCPSCRVEVPALDCPTCGDKVPMRCQVPECGQPLRMSVPGDWKAMDKWASKMFPQEWGDRINVDVQGQLRAFMLACMEEFSEEPEIFERILRIAAEGAGAGVEPSARRRG